MSTPASLDVTPSAPSVSTPRFSAVLSPPAAEPALARAHFAARLAFETDVADLMHDLAQGDPGLTVIDTRSPAAFALCHIPGAINLPRINATTTAVLSKDKVHVVYCWGLACNGATRAALRLTELGFAVKELAGGIEYWRHEGGPVEGSLGNEAPLYWQPGA
jgi:rhodanese-related sulfurtransferase